MKNSESTHYVNNAEFSNAVVEHVNRVSAAMAVPETPPPLTDYIATCFFKIGEGLSHKPNFAGYSFREDMVMDAVQNCIKVVKNYNVNAATRTGNPNAFGYFTQIAYYAFLRRIAKEEKFQDIKDLYIQHAGIEAFGDFSAGNQGDSIIERVRIHTSKVRQRDNKLKEINKRRKKKPKNDDAHENSLYRAVEG
jgi:hypothetical protein